MPVSAVSKSPIREAPVWHKFKIQMYEFSCEGLSTSDPIEPYLKVDFDNFKLFQTDHETNNANPEWAFKAGFQYPLNYLEQLSRRRCHIQCLDRVAKQIIGEAELDLQTIACGPSHFVLTLRDHVSKEPRGTLKFICVMKMISPNLSVVVRNLRLTMLGSPAAAKLSISATLAETDVVRVPYSHEGAWEGPFSLSFETCLADLLKAPDEESLRLVVIDDSGMTQGEALLAFRSHFNTKADVPVPFKVSVTYSYQDGQERMDPVGAVGELEGELVYQNLPVYAQMRGGTCIDGEVDGGHWLIEGLPYPQSMQQPPPLWQDPAEVERVGFESLITNPDEGEHESNLDDIDDKTFFEALEKIDLPPPWEKRHERAAGAGTAGRLYFADPRSRRTTWKDPRFLPENWDQRIDPQTGKVYFQYHKTRQITYVDPRGCPPGWDMRLSKTGDIYFAYFPAMQTSFTDPRGLPDTWDAALDDQARMYFKNHAAKSTSWEDPRRDQQEVTLTKWRQDQARRWWKEQVWREVEEMQRQRELEDREAEEMEAAS